MEKFKQEFQDAVNNGGTYDSLWIIIRDDLIELPNVKHISNVLQLINDSKNPRKFDQNPIVI